MKTASLLMVTLYVLYWVYNNIPAIVHDPCWQSSGKVSDRVALSLIIVFPTALALAALVYLWSCL